MKIIITTSTLPASDNDKVPAFVKDQAIELKKKHPNTEIIIHAPHNFYSQTSKSAIKYASYRDVRFHYFWPYQWELLTGRGILPALRQNKLLYLQVPFLLFFQFTSLWSLVYKERPDLIYAHWFTPQAISAAMVSRLTGTPFIFTTHASDVAVLKKLPLSRKLVAWVCRHASAFTAVSERTTNKLKYFFDPQTWNNNFAHKLSIIPMGVRTDIPSISKSQIDKTKNQFDLPANKQFVLFLGRLAEKKGVKFLLQGFAKLPEATSANLHLIIAGDGQLKERLEKDAKKLGIKNVTFTGYVTGTTKDALFALADYACFPSIIDDSGDSEGFPVVLMESLAAGKIVLASNATGGETILTEGASGYIFAEKSAESITSALVKASQLNITQRSTMRKQAEELAKQFDWDTITEKHHQVFREVLHENTYHK